MDRGAALQVDSRRADPRSARESLRACARERPKLYATAVAGGGFSEHARGRPRWKQLVNGNYPSPGYFVSVASKRLTVLLSHLESTVAGNLICVDYKEFNSRVIDPHPSNEKAAEGLPQRRYAQFPENKNTTKRHKSKRLTEKCEGEGACGCGSWPANSCCRSTGACWARAFSC